MFYGEKIDEIPDVTYLIGDLPAAIHDYSLWCCFGIKQRV